MKYLTTVGLTALLLAGVISCRRQDNSANQPVPLAQSKGGLSILSGSENKSLEPLLQQFGRQSGIKVGVSYMGSIEIGQELAKGRQCAYDAIWPAASLWIEMFDQAKVSKNVESIMRTPVVFALKK